MGVEYIAICPRTKTFMELGKLNHTEAHAPELLEFMMAHAGQYTLVLTDQQFIDWWNREYPDEAHDPTNQLPHYPGYSGPWQQYLNDDKATIRELRAEAAASMMFTTELIRTNAEKLGKLKGDWQRLRELLVDKKVPMAEIDKVCWYREETLKSLSLMMINATPEERLAKAKEHLANAEAAVAESQALKKLQGG